MGRVYSSWVNIILCCLGPRRIELWVPTSMGSQRRRESGPEGAICGAREFSGCRFVVVLVETNIKVMLEKRRLQGLMEVAW